MIKNRAIYSLLLLFENDLKKDASIKTFKLKFILPVLFFKERGGEGVILCLTKHTDIQYQPF